MGTKFVNLLSEVAGYYSVKLGEFGETPRGVDWNGEASQRVRFGQLLKIVSSPDGASLTDFGCGYGALLDYLYLCGYTNVSYIGCDISDDMIRAAQARHARNPRARFATGSEPPEETDYCLASGIFNVRLERSDGEWYDYITETLDVLNRKCRLGFAFNCLSSYSDKEKKRDYLYYCDPCKMFDFCKRQYSHEVALLHDYGLYEFTILVRKNREAAPITES